MRQASILGRLGGLLVAGLIASAQAGEITTLGPLEIDTPWARASIGAARPSAAYVTIRNTGDAADRLVAVASPLAARPELHEMVEEDGVMKMRAAGQVEIPPGGEIRLEPGGRHIMLMELQQPLEEGGRLPLTLTFEGAGEVSIEAPIGGPGATEPPG